VKRFLLHKQRESDDQSGEIELVEIKQDLQMIRYEMANDLDRIRYETFRLVSHVATGIAILGEHAFSSTSQNDGEPAAETAMRHDKFKEFVNFDLASIESPAKTRRATTANIQAQHRQQKTPAAAHSNSPKSSSPMLLRSDLVVDDEDNNDATAAARDREISPELIRLNDGKFMQINIIPPPTDLDSIREESAAEVIYSGAKNSKYVNENV
jgi:hypothetical protein